MKKSVYLFLLFLPVQLFSTEINIHNIMKVNIPDKIEIISVEHSLQKHSKSDQFNLRLNVQMVYANKYFLYRIDLFGYGDSIKYNKLASLLNQDPNKTYYPIYKTASQINFLKDNYKNYTEKTGSGVKFSRFVSSWGGGWSSDYYGVYFLLNNKYFSEVIINTVNIWSAYEGHNLLLNDREFRDKAKTLSKDGQKFISLVDEIIESIEISSTTEKIINNEDIEISNCKPIKGFFIPTIENLRLRSEPNINSNILGYVKDVPYVIIDSGPEISVDGIDGKWLRIKTFIGPSIGWAFSGYIRKITEEEEAEYLEGI